MIAVPIGPALNLWLVPLHSIWQRMVYQEIRKPCLNIIVCSFASQSGCGLRLGILCTKKLLWRSDLWIFDLRRLPDFGASSTR